MAENENLTQEGVLGDGVEESVAGAQRSSGSEAITVDELSVVSLGRQGENGVTTVRIDCSDWTQELSGCDLVLAVTRCGENTVYLPEIETDAGVIIWPITNTDTACGGWGCAEVRAILDEKIRKSAIFHTRVEPALEDGRPGTPEPPDWVQEIMGSVDAAEQAAEDAEAQVEAAVAAAVNAVRFDEDQGLTDAQMLQARSNLNVGSAFEMPNLFDAAGVVQGENTFTMFINLSSGHPLTSTSGYRLIVLPAIEGHVYRISCGGQSTKRWGYITEEPALGVNVSGYGTDVGPITDAEITVGDGGRYICLQLFINNDPDMDPTHYYGSIVVHDVTAGLMAIDSSARVQIADLDAEIERVDDVAEGAVSYAAEQELGDDDQARARGNIGAAADADLTALQGDVADLTADEAELAKIVALTVDYAKTPIANSYVNANNGKLMSGNGYERTDYVAVSTTMKYRYSGRTYKSAGIAAYDSNKKYIDTVLPVGTGSDDYTNQLLTLPDGTAYIVASNRTTYAGTFSLVSTGDPGTEIAKLIAATAAMNELEPTDMTCASMFERIGICGDSYASGNIYDIAPYTGRHENVSWGHILGRRNGIDVSLYSKAAANTITWQTDAACLPLLLSDDPCQLYVLILGINGEHRGEGSTTVEDIDTIEDVNDEDPTQNADTMYGRYAQIYCAIHDYSPTSKIVFATPAYKPASIGAVWQAKLGCINGLAEHYGVPVIDMMSDALFNTSFYTSNLRTGHPIAPVYAGIAVAFEKRLAQCIVENVEYFTDYVGATGDVPQ